MRINVIGTSGSGKTTFGKKLAEAINHPFYEMDAEFWGPDWYYPTDEEFFPRIKKILDGENWVLDGNYTRTMGFKWERVQVVIWLNYSYPRTVYQAVSRALTRLVDQKELWPGTGNRENLKMLFSRNSIVWWTISRYHGQTKRNARYLDSEEFSNIKFHRIRSPRQANQFLKAARQDPGHILVNTNRSSRI